MPKIPSDLRDSADEAASATGDFTAMDDGIYTARLSKCEATQSKAQKPMWRLEFDMIHDLEGKKQPGRLFTNITIEEKTMWKVAQFYAAFGAPTSADTDELVNNRIRLEVTKKVQDYAASKMYGKEVNEVGRFIALAESDQGYDKAVQLKSKLNKGSKSSPAPKKATPASVEADTSAPFAVDDDEDSVDF